VVAGGDHCNARSEVTGCAATAVTNYLVVAIRRAAPLLRAAQAGEHFRRPFASTKTHHVPFQESASARSYGLDPPAVWKCDERDSAN
jgi:hypothetical protein